MSEKIGFVGVGRMGANMARRLKDCGYEVTAVNDINKEAAAALAEELGAQHCEGLADVTAASDGTGEISLNLDLTPSLKGKATLGSDGDSGIGIFFERDY